MIFEYQVSGVIRIDAETREQANEKLGHYIGGAIHFKRLQCASDFEATNNLLPHIEEFTVIPPLPVDAPPST